MRFSDLHPCDGCGQGLGMHFLRVVLHMECVDENEARNRMGLDMMFPGAPGLAATVHGDPADATKSEHKGTALLCITCAAPLLSIGGVDKAVLRTATAAPGAARNHAGAAEGQ